METFIGQMLQYLDIHASYIMVGSDYSYTRPLPPQYRRSRDWRKTEVFENGGKGSLYYDKEKHIFGNWKSAAVLEGGGHRAAVLGGGGHRAAVLGGGGHLAAVLGGGGHLAAVLVGERLYLYSTVCHC